MATTDITVEELTLPATDFDRNSYRAPHQLVGKDKRVYWCQCDKVLLARKVGDHYENIRFIQENSGETILPGGLALKIFGPTAKAKEA